MSQSYKIGRLVQLGVAKESTRGTTPASASYWLAWDDLSLDEQRKLIPDESAFGIIENLTGYQLGKRWIEGTVKAPVTQTSFGLFLLSIFGTDTPALHGYESLVYDHKFTVAESAQHQSLSLYVHDPNVQDYSHANSVVHKLDIEYALQKFLIYSASILGLTGVAQSAYSPSQTQENRFAAPYGSLAVAPTKAGLAKTVVGTGTAASTIHVTAVSGFTTDQIAVGQTVIGVNIPSGTTVATIVSATAFDLSQASTGNAADLTIGNLAATGTASTTVHVTALSINTNLLQVGMTVTGVNIPAGATVAKIVSSTAFDLSIASSGAASYMMFGGLVLPIKSAKISIDGGGEAFDASGSADPYDFFNKEFKLTGTVEAIFRNETDFKSAFQAVNPSALLFSFVNTGVVIGTGANPACIVTVDQAYFSKFVIKRTVKDLIYATATFEAVYNLTNSEMANVVLTNILASY